MEKEKLCTSIYEVSTLFNELFYCDEDSLFDEYTGIRKEIVMMSYNWNKEQKIVSILKNNKKDTIMNIIDILSNKKEISELLKKIEISLEHGPLEEIDETVLFYFDKCSPDISKAVISEKFDNQYDKYWPLFLKLKQLEKDVYSYYETI